jgi:dolichyl-phosphate beta-glucosyltransferase
MSPALSLIIPAYNESARLPPFLQTTRDYLAAVFGERYEVIVVDDGSADGMPGILAAAAGDWPQLSVLRHAQNQGKGAAVRTGMLAARGELLLFADADGATPIAEEARLRAAIEAGADLAVGSRLTAGAHVATERHWLRGLLGRMFASLARRCAGTAVRDTQCGFKMFRREVGRTLFSRVQERGYLLDVEVLLWAERLGYRIAEVPVNWTEQADSRLNMRRDGWKMLYGLWRLRRRTAQQPSGDAESLPPAAS